MRIQVNRQGLAPTVVPCTENILARFLLDVFGGGYNPQQVEKAMDAQTRLMKGEVVALKHSSIQLLPDEELGEEDVE